VLIIQLQDDIVSTFCIRPMNDKRKQNVAICNCFKCHALLMLFESAIQLIKVKLDRNHNKR